ncbi:sugar ABC transporter permease [Litorilinea aerophila]|uniref:Sugar ABC transporter permease n=1 Tax=Litorilinea aerophila TaxID=1204385 RepID=A0A540VIL5_9CHLR|nr:sugar ABC transporter permease [Litorilinea aerophila]MCC9076359.1 sugar ABC transporter permease [Litorilinea aerophila]
MSFTLPMSPRKRRNLILGLLFASPWIIGFLAFTIIPILSSLYYSFTRYDLLRPPHFLGLDNYINLFTNDDDFRLVAYNTLWWVLISAPMGVLSAFLMALLLNTRIWWRSLFRAIFFFPSIVPVVVTAFVWQFLLNVQYGAINSTLQGLGLPTIPFLSSPTLVKPSLVLIHMWSQGAAMVIFLATLQDVPRSLYEAATVDGANALRKLWHITIPMVSPVILFNLVMSFIGGFQYFTLPWLLTQGGPSKATEFYALFLYRNAFIFLRMGKASALAWILFVVIVVFTYLLFRFSGRFVYYAGASR